MDGHGLGIVVLVVCAIGVYSILRWVYTQISALFDNLHVKQPGQQQKPGKKKYIRIGHERKLVCYDDLPEANKYKGRTWLWGLPVLADVVRADKHDYSTIIYMDHWFKQYVHDVMVTRYDCLAVLLFPLMLVFWNPVLGLAITAIIWIYIQFWFNPSVERGVRRMGENAKNLTPMDWAKIYDEVAKDLAEEERLVRAMRRSGPPGWWWH